MTTRRSWPPSTTWPSSCASACVSLLIVSNEVGEGVHPPTELGRRYRDLLGFVNQRLAAAADRVTLMVAGIPVPVKDTPPPPTRREPTHEAP